jgi:transglutaminase-like putative cysteine protease
MRKLIKLAIIGFIGALSYKYICEKGYMVADPTDNVITLIKENARKHLDNLNISLEPDKVLSQNSTTRPIPSDTGVKLNRSKPAISISDKNTATLDSNPHFGSEKENDSNTTLPAYFKNSFIPHDRELYAEIDKFALAVPDSVSSDLSSLVACLIRPAKTDIERARLLFGWIARNISYDDYGYNTGNYGDMSAIGVLQSRTSVCSGFAELFRAMGEEAGLDIVKISGYAKGYGHRKGQAITRTNHAWNAINIDGQWKLFDVTWAHGSGKTVNGRLKSVQEFDDFWFDTNPYAFIFSHLPQDHQWQLIDKPLSKADFERLPYISSSFFAMGFDGETVLKKIFSGEIVSLPVAYGHGNHIQAISLPSSGILKQRQSIQFVLQSSSANAMAVINNGKWIHFKQEDDFFHLTIQPEPGELALTVNLDKQSTSYNRLLAYKVK